MSHPSPNSRVWFITGSSQGLGLALLTHILSLGYRAVATLRNPSSGALSSLTAQYPSSQLLILKLDVSKPEDIEEAFEKTKEHFGRIDVIVNNAGYGLSSEIETTPDEEARKLFEVLFWGPVNICKEAIKFMRDVNPAGEGGRIFNISSAGGYSANAALAFYSAGKFALEGFTEALSKEMLPSWNIKAHIIEPGGFETSWSSSSMIDIPSSPLYSTPESPSLQMRNIRKANKFIGDPSKAASALAELAGESWNGKELPMRIQLGSDALLLVRYKARKTIKDGETWENVSRSTDSDGTDREKIEEMFKAAFS